jgi:hypothetical protein
MERAEIVQAQNEVERTRQAIALQEAQSRAAGLEKEVADLSRAIPSQKRAIAYRNSHAQTARPSSVNASVQIPRPPTATAQAQTPNPKTAAVSIQTALIESIPRKRFVTPGEGAPELPEQATQTAKPAMWHRSCQIALPASLSTAVQTPPLETSPEDSSQKRSVRLPGQQRLSDEATSDQATQSHGANLGLCERCQRVQDALKQSTGSQCDPCSREADSCTAQFCTSPGPCTGPEPHDPVTGEPGPSIPSGSRGPAGCDPHGSREAHTSGAPGSLGECAGGQQALHGTVPPKSLGSEGVDACRSHGSHGTEPCRGSALPTLDAKLQGALQEVARLRPLAQERNMQLEAVMEQLQVGVAFLQTFCLRHSSCQDWQCGHICIIAEGQLFQYLVFSRKELLVKAQAT